MNLYLQQTKSVQNEFEHHQWQFYFGCKKQLLFVHVAVGFHVYAPAFFLLKYGLKAQKILSVLQIKVFKNTFYYVESDYSVWGQLHRLY